MGLRITGLMPHGATYWEDNGVTDPTRDDYIFHIEYNYISKVGKILLKCIKDTDTWEGCIFCILQILNLDTDTKYH